MGRRFSLPVLAALFLAGCGGSDGPLRIAFVDTSEELFAGGARLSAGAQHLRAATQSGLVTLDEQGEVVPALADRWIVTDDGRSFIFRLRDGAWPDGRELTAESVRAALAETIRALRGTSLGLDLQSVREIRAMAGRVIELRLAHPQPSLLQLLAQPELALHRGEGATGPMTLRRTGQLAVLAMKAPAERGLPEEEGWQDHVRPLELSAANARDAIARFDAGEVDVVLGGRLGALPLAPTGPLSRGTVQIDPAIGLFGLQVRRARGLLSTARGREALSMTFDRAALIAQFNVGGWVATSRVVPPGLPNDPGLIAERWDSEAIEQLRRQAAARVAQWSRANGGEPVALSLALNRSPGNDLLFTELAAQLAAIGVELRRVAEGSAADLVLVDRVARYAAPGWFLNQFACALRQGLCDEEADALAAAGEVEPEPAARARIFAQAEAKLTLANVFIPFGSPLRFSLVRSGVTGFSPNAWAFHPLPPLAVVPR